MINNHSAGKRSQIVKKHHLPLGSHDLAIFDFERFDVNIDFTIDPQQIQLIERRSLFFSLNHTFDIRLTHAVYLVYFYYT